MVKKKTINKDRCQRQYGIAVHIVQDRHVDSLPGHWEEWDWNERIANLASRIENDQIRCWI